MDEEIYITKGDLVIFTHLGESKKCFLWLVYEVQPKETFSSWHVKWISLDSNTPMEGSLPRSTSFRIGRPKYSFQVFREGKEVHQHSKDEISLAEYLG